MYNSANNNTNTSPFGPNFNMMSNASSPVKQANDFNESSKKLKMPIIINSNIADDNIFTNSVQIQIKNVASKSPRTQKRHMLNDAAVKKSRFELDRKKKKFEVNPSRNFNFSQAMNTQQQGNNNLMNNNFLDTSALSINSQMQGLTLNRYQNTLRDIGDEMQST